MFRAAQVAVAVLGTTLVGFAVTVHVRQQLIFSNVPFPALNPMKSLQKTVDCWALEGRWTREPGSFYGRVWGEDWPRSTLGDCHANMTVRDRSTELAFQWVPPPTCAPRAYVRSVELARALLDRLVCLKILVVGDSLSHDMVTTLHEYIRTVHELGKRSVNKLPVHFVRNDHVAVDDEHVSEPQTRKEPWKHLTQNDTFDVILLNRGAHYVPIDRFVVEYRATLSYVRGTNPKALIVVRTTPSGHWNCSQFVNAPPLSSPLPPAPAESRFHAFQWDKFQVQNALLRQMIESDDQLAFHVVVMDIACATNLRADSHRTNFDDCLHYCMPGPIDMWVELFGNLLLRMQDVDLLRPCQGSLGTTQSSPAAIVSDRYRARS